MQVAIGVIGRHSVSKNGIYSDPSRLNLTCKQRMTKLVAQLQLLIKFIFV